MSEGTDDPKPPDEKRPPPPPTALRLTREAADALDALQRAAGKRLSRHALAVAALTYGARRLAADPVALLRVVAGDALADAAAEARAPTPVAPAATPVAASSTAGDDGAQPPPPSPRPSLPPAPPRGARVEALTLDGNPGRRLAADELAPLRASVVGAFQRGASAAGLARAAGHEGSGAVRRTLTALRDGAEVNVTARLAAELAPAAEGWGR